MPLLWLAQGIGISVGEEPKRTMYSVSGMPGVYSSEVATGMQYDNRWIDMVTVKVAVPGTARTRGPDSRWPFLLGLGGPFKELGVCINHAEESFRLGRVGDWPRNGIRWRDRRHSAAFGHGSRTDSIVPGRGAPLSLQKALQCKAGSGGADGPDRRQGLAQDLGA